MKFALALVLFGGPPRDKPKDAWFGRDKFLHFAASAVVQGAAYAVFRRAARCAVAAERASLMTVAVGAGKELYDWRHPATHDASWRDFTWDLVGGAAATVVVHQAAR